MLADDLEDVERVMSVVCKKEWVNDCVEMNRCKGKSSPCGEDCNTSEYKSQWFRCREKSLHNFECRGYRKRPGEKEHVWPDVKHLRSMYSNDVVRFITYSNTVRLLDVRRRKQVIPRTTPPFQATKATKTLSSMRDG